MMRDTGNALKLAPSRAIQDNVTVHHQLPELRANLVRYCVGLTGCQDVAEDLVQDTLLRTLPILEGTQSHPNPKAYAMRVAKHLWIDRLRRNRMERSALTTVAHFDINLVTEHEGLNRMAGEDAVRMLIQHLTPLQRTIFLLRDIFGYRTSEVSKLLGMTETSVKAALLRARQRIEKMADMRDTKAESGDMEIPQAFFQAYVEAIRRCDVPLLIQLSNISQIQLMQAQARVIGQSFRRSQAQARSQSVQCAA